MKLGVLFSGGKDSCLALARVLEKGEQVVCLITIRSRNKDSFMFHTPNVNLAVKQAEAIGLPLVEGETRGEKEEELKDLVEIIEKAKREYKIDGIVTGAIASVYQSERIKKICDSLGLKCINPLWGMSQERVLREIVERKFEVYVIAVNADGFDSSWLGKKIDDKTIEDLLKLEKKYKINIAGEGGEIESFVCDAPFFEKKIEIISAEKEFKNYSGIWKIKEVKLTNKKID